MPTLFKSHLAAIISFLVFIPGNLIANKNNDTILDSLYQEVKQELYNNPLRIIHLCNQAMAYHDTNLNRKAEFQLSYAMAQRMQGDYEGCITTLYDIQQLLKNNKQAIIYGKANNLMSICYCYLHDYTTAIRLNKEATEIFQHHNDSSLLASAYNSCGIIHAYLEEYSDADKYIKKALKINRQRKDLIQIAANLNNLCIYPGDFNEKINYINEAIIINKNLNTKWSISENLNNMGMQYYYAHKYNKALEILKKAYNIAYSIDAKGLICDNYEYSSKVYQALGDYKNAYKKRIALSNLRNKTQNVNKLWAIERNISQKQLQAQQKNAEQQTQHYQIKLWYTYFTAIIIVICLLAIICLFIFQRYKRRKKMELIKTRYQLEQSEHEIAKLKVQQQELDIKNIKQVLNNSVKETTDVAIFMQTRNELLDKIYDQIKECYKLNQTDIVPQLKRINAFIKQNQANNKTNNSILNLIEKKSQEFIERLTLKHPNLTHGEVHLASLLRVDISTKDIAILTGNSPKSINMSRYRLRKSLNLESEEDLVAYLKSI